MNTDRGSNYSPMFGADHALKKPAFKKDCNKYITKNQRTKPTLWLVRLSIQMLELKWALLLLKRTLGFFKADAKRTQSLFLGPSYLGPIL